MQITRQTEYAVRTLLELAAAPVGETVSTRLISERQGIPDEFLKKTIQLLVPAHLVTTHRGTGGGVRLAKPATDITLLDIITAIEGTLALNVCLAPDYHCPNKPNCSLSRILGKAQEALLEELQRETLADMINSQK
ncbi:MAG: Rrf2 family transcriptional regulator [Syntrophomonadaceae bacterium]|nr:Rrf2 family transcriptional regulator [Syntrophomonadaceae bacterium]